MEVSVSLEDKAVSRYSVSVSPVCPDGSTAKGQSCSGVQRNQTVNTQADLQYRTTWLTKCKNLAKFYLIFTEGPQRCHMTFIGSHTHCQTSLRAKDLVNNPCWADYRLCLTGKHFHVIPWSFCPKIFTLPYMRAYKVNRTFIFRNRSFGHPLLPCLLHWSRKRKALARVARVIQCYSF